MAVMEHALPACMRTRTNAKGYATHCAQLEDSTPQSSRQATVGVGEVGGGRWGEEEKVERRVAEEEEEGGEEEEENEGVEEDKDAE